MRINFPDNIFRVKVLTSMIDLNNLFAIITKRFVDQAVQDHFLDITELTPKLYHFDQVSWFQTGVIFRGKNLKEERNSRKIQCNVLQFNFVNFIMKRTSTRDRR